MFGTNVRIHGAKTYVVLRKPGSYLFAVVGETVCSDNRIFHYFAGESHVTQVIGRPLSCRGTSRRADVIHC